MTEPIQLQSKPITNVAQWKVQKGGCEKKLQEPSIFAHEISVLSDFLKKQIISKQSEKTPWKNSVFVILLARGFFLNGNTF